ncbi:non-hydrolyzing UDP-N-acetylglucosamine 2-epimerase [Biformimicrobium ophioploci]|uniref:UDP-N-acetylglucosamine 2-epimerase (Non-hydrolyzing) n=1 Tax=Biformimicrobium ophioploci TaxID=3036711 RepID=A0ABQ6LXJ9_9GAMM|nr:UDP-N-acetylglucosamine 2-epimerase (non-hydrolyzing) [Microbulbifer sp. NKW57]GMG86783.1 UDP-N-acetylglucosamine 2-epimerase (non-hydrolyzing) [Microbulbifer sp. NKW57]
MKEILFVTGTRPEIIKMAPVYLLLKEAEKDCRVSWCHTGQHDTVADAMFSQFSIKPEITLPRPAGIGLAPLVSGLIESIDRVLEEYCPDLVVVHGDTSSTLAASMAAFYRSIEIAHIEAGLRSNDLRHPFPEESNRKMVATIAEKHFAPTELARTNLLKEGVPSENIVVTGNTVVDAQKIICRVFSIKPKAERDNILVTVHRRENWAKLQSISETILELAQIHPEFRFLIPLHPNPAVSTVFRNTLKNIQNVSLTAPMSYLELQRCLSRCRVAITDSGGIQEEAPGFSVPCVVLREKTERPEAISSGFAELVGTDRAKILEHSEDCLGKPIRHMKNPFGDGYAAQRIVNSLLDYGSGSNTIAIPKDESHA